MIESFGVRLQERIRDLGPLCVGIDPSGSQIEKWGRSDSVDALEFFSLAVLEAVIDTAAVVKPQVSYFERFGSEGYRVLERLLEEARDANVMVIADVKRGDIGSTNEGYAEAWLSDASPLRVDALTLNSFLGVESLTPFFRRAQEGGRGAFVLSATSNIEGRQIQRARTAEDVSVEALILRSIAGLNAQHDGLGSLGVVLGATRERPEFDLAELAGPYLVPGVGAQGANSDQVARLFDRCPVGTVLVNVGRAILDRGPERAALRDAARRWRDELSGALL
ncbi:MAG: orotidine-5'-phosphate decarboxylase [Acidobacteria bacterium]|nr:orotidine-5'-phosphate decarboxylase [Acidobacteriota bacterium]